MTQKEIKIKKNYHRGETLRAHSMGGEKRHRAREVRMGAGLHDIVDDAIFQNVDCYEALEIL